MFESATPPMTTVRPLGRLAAAVALVLGFSAAGGAQAADAVADFYKGKSIEIIIGSAPGGGFDAYARLVARHMGKYIPGNPNMVPKNLPGAGSARAAAQLYASAPKDGTAMGALFPGGVVDPLFDPSKLSQYDPTKFYYLGSANNEVAVCMIWHEVPVKTMAEALQKEVIVGASASGGSSRDFAASLVNGIGAKLKIVSGYAGSKDMLLAMERGETAGICGQLWSTVTTQNQDWLRDKKLMIWVQMALKPHPDLPNVPMVWDFVKNDRDRQALELIYGQLVFGRPYMLPPGVPADRAKALRAAFAATMADPEYKAEAARAKLEVQPVGGEEVQALVAKMFATDPAIIAAAAKAQKVK